MAKPANKKTLSGNTIQVDGVGKKTRQGNGKRSKPKLGHKKYRGQGK
jgi:hypothetical protein